MPTVASNGINIYYEVHGEGEPVLLIGGLSNDVSDYERTNVTPLLAKHFKLIVFDNRGAGRSDMPDEPYSMEMMAEDALGLLRALGITRTHVIGISLGGRIALELALRAPQVVNKLVLVSTGPRTVNSWRRRLLFAFVRFAPRLKGKHPQPRYAFERQRAASSSYNCTERLHEIQIPTLIMHGKDDHIAPFAIAEDMSRKIPNAKMAALPGGHVFFFFQPQKFVDGVTEFLKQD